MSAVDLLIVAGVALVAGVINSIAGGGSLILFPTLVALGLPTVAANVTNSVSQWPGYLGGALGVILLAVLGIGLHRLKLANALKSALSVVTASVNIVVFGLFGPIHWIVVLVAAPASLVGGFIGARIASRIPTTPLRIFIVAFGVAVAIYLFLRV